MKCVETIRRYMWDHLQSIFDLGHHAQVGQQLRDLSLNGEPKGEIGMFGDVPIYWFHIAGIAGIGIVVLGILGFISGGAHKPREGAAKMPKSKKKKDKTDFKKLRQQRDRK